MAITGQGRVGIRQYVAPAPSSSYGTLTTQWIATTGESDATIISALNALETGLNANGLTSLIDVLYPMVGGTSSKCSKNFMNTSTFPIAFNGGWVFASTGIKGNGANAYGNTGFSPFVSSKDNGAWGIYLRNILNNGVYIHGTYSGGGQGYYGLGDRNSTSEYFMMNSNDPYQTVPTDSVGLWQCSADSATNKLFTSINANQYQTTATINASAGNPVFLNSWNNLGSPYTYGTQEIALFYLTKNKLTQAQQLILNTLVTQFQTTLGRQV